MRDRSPGVRRHQPESLPERGFFSDDRLHCHLPTATHPGWPFLNSSQRQCGLAGANCPGARRQVTPSATSQDAGSFLAGLDDFVVSRHRRNRQRQEPRPEPRPNEPSSSGNLDEGRKVTSERTRPSSTNEPDARRSCGASEREEIIRTNLAPAGSRPQAHQTNPAKRPPGGTGPPTTSNDLRLRVRTNPAQWGKPRRHES
jgi:hypothetical protein